MKILYVENHSVFAEGVIRQFLSSHEVTVVPSLALARQRFQTGNFELVLIDYDLDDGKGTDLVIEIRLLSPILPVIAVSSHDEGNQALLKAGATAICDKMNFDKIQTVMDRIGAT